MDIFRSALLALLPSLSRAHISWAEDKSYDDWDRIAEALFDSIVLDAIRFADGGSESLKFPAYGLHLGDYSAVSYLEVRRDEFVGAFVELVPGHEDQFNLVRAIPVDAQGNVLGSTEAVALSEVEFSARLRLPDGPSVTLGDLSVSL